MATEMFAQLERSAPVSDVCARPLVARPRAPRIFCPWLLWSRLSPNAGTGGGYRLERERFSRKELANASPPTYRGKFELFPGQRDMRMELSRPDP